MMVANSRVKLPAPEIVMTLLGLGFAIAYLLFFYSS